MQFSKRCVNVPNGRNLVALKIVSRFVLQLVLHLLELPD